MKTSFLLSWNILTWLHFVQAAPSNCGHPKGLIDLGYARHVPTYVNTTATGKNVSIYKNVRFANPPTGERRFRKPDTDLPKMEGIQTGEVPWTSTACIASAPAYLSYMGINGTWGHEDCLFLDVYVPEGVKPGDHVPVLHWFFGSAYAFGDKDVLFSPMGLFDGNKIQNDFIFVASNYRLGILGWTSVPGLDMDANVGLLDCLAAAEWTSRYIERFGGDSKRVTVIGQSAGAGMIDLMTNLDGGEGKLPFQQAWISSPDIPPRNNTADRRQELFQAVLNATNCTDLVCARAVPEEVMIKANDYLVLDTPSTGGGGVYGPSLGFGPVPDGTRLPGMPEALFREGRYHKDLRGLVIGNMANEGMGLSDDKNMPAAFPRLAREILTTASNETIDALESMYTNLSEPAELAWDWTTDVIFACNAYNLAGAYSDRAKRYIMTLPPATHGEDLMYYFFVNNATTPVSDPSLVPDFQNRLLKFVHGVEDDWPTYAHEKLIFNISAAGFEITPLSSSSVEKCEKINAVVLDPENGV